MQATRSKPLIRPMPFSWWLRNRYLALFMVRELTCLFVGGYAAYLLCIWYHARLGQETFDLYFRETILCKWGIALQVVTLAMVLYHAVTWLNLTPKVVIIWRGEEKVSPVIIAGAHYVLWLAASVVVWWLVVR